MAGLCGCLLMERKDAGMDEFRDEQVSEWDNLVVGSAE